MGVFYLVNLAERQGFEPWVQLPVQRFSRPSRSTTPASFLLGSIAVAKLVFILIVVSFVAKKIYFFCVAFQKKVAFVVLLCCKSV